MSKEGPTPTPGDSPGSTTPQTALSPLPVAPSDVLPTPADLFPGYEILKKIGEGGQGIVYLALQLSTKQKVALKVLRHGHYAGSAARRRFQSEIETLAQLRRFPDIIPIYDADIAKDGRQFFVMDYVHGQRLDEYVSTRLTSRQQIIKLFIDICRAVQHAHQRGIVHRDLKPANILVDGDGGPHILDFGLARPLAASADPQLIAGQGWEGTLQYLSPEQASGDLDLIDQRSDVYTLGVILYELLTGSVPYDISGDPPYDTARQNIIHTPPRHPRLVCKGLNKRLEKILLNCLEKNRKDRYENAAALQTELEALLEKPYSAKHPVLTCLVIIALAFFFAIFVGDRLFFNWTRAGIDVDRFLTRSLQNQPIAASGTPDLQQVRIIAITKNTDIYALAKRESLQDVTASTPQSRRRLHGKLMERLAKAGVRAVAFDFDFVGDSPFDADFVRGAQSLHKVGADVIVNVMVWPLQGLSAEYLSPKIAKTVRWGCPLADLNAQSTWKLVLFSQRGLAEPVPSMALITLAARRHPDAEPVFRVDEAGETMEILYGKKDPNIPRSITWLDPPDHVELSFVKTWTKDTPESGLKTGDRVGYFVIPMPNDKVMASSTIDYREIFTMPPDDLKDILRDKVVVIGDLTCKDWHDHPDGRTLPGCYAHAVGIDMLLRSVSIGRPRAEARSIITGVGSLLGCLIVAFAARRRLKAYLLAVTIAAAAFGTSLVIARWGGVVWNPLLPILAMIIACELSLWTDRRITLKKGDF